MASALLLMFMISIATVTGNDDDFFETLKLKENLLRGIHTVGLEKPSLLQQHAISSFITVVSGRHVIVQTPAGTDRTVTISVPILQLIDESSAQLQAVVMAPSRDQVDKIQKVMSDLGQFMNITVHAIGRSSVRDDMEKVQAGGHVVVGTPGRIHDMIQRHSLRTDHVQILVLDDADQMLDGSEDDQIVIAFSEKIEDAISFMPDNIQIVMFSATLDTYGFPKFTEKFVKDPIKITVEGDAITVERPL